MLFLSGLTLTTIALGFLANSLVPFEEPISVLINGSQPWAYHGSLLAVALTLAWYAWRRAWPEGGLSLGLSGTVMVLVLLLLIVDFRIQPAHDCLSAFLIFVSSVFLLHLTSRQGSWLLKVLVGSSFLTLPLIFTGNLRAIGVVELVFLSWSLVILNLSYYRRTPAALGEGVTRLRDLVHTGSPLRGYAWASLCAFICGISGVYSRGFLTGVVHLAFAWGAACLSPHFEGLLLLEALPFAASGVGFLFGLAALGWIRTAELVLPCFVMATAQVLAITYRLQAEELGYLPALRRRRS
jgi:hypothetical protein